MTNLIVFLSGILALVLFARTNRSNKVFWTGLTVYLLGWVMGGVVAMIKYHSDDSSKAQIMQVVPMQNAMLPAMDFLAVANCDHVTNVTNFAGKDEPVRDNDLESFYDLRVQGILVPRGPHVGVIPIDSS